MQRARYENLVFLIAEAYSGSSFSLPAFVDRSGILHFHERDLARSLLMFADVPQTQEYNSEMIQS